MSQQVIYLINYVPSVFQGKKRLNEYGIQGVESLTLVPDTQNEGKNRGFAFLEFSCHGDAMIAFERLQEPDVVFGHPERTAKVAFAEPIKETDAEVLYKVLEPTFTILPLVFIENSFIPKLP